MGNAHRGETLRPTALLMIMIVLVTALLFGHATPLQAAPALQDATGTSPQLYLLPQNPMTTNIIVETHIVTLRILDQEGTPQVVVDGTYRLHNPADEAVGVPLRLLAGGDATVGDIQAVSLTQNGETVALTPSGDGGYVGETVLDAVGAPRCAWSIRLPWGQATWRLCAMRRPYSMAGQATFRCASSLLSHVDPTGKLDRGESLYLGIWRIHRSGRQYRPLAL